MRSYQTIPEEKIVIEKIICNACGREIEKDAHGYFADSLHVEKTWGYHSNKDGKTHSFDICESCYDQWTGTFCCKL